MIKQTQRILSMLLICSTAVGSLCLSVLAADSTAAAKTETVINRDGTQTTKTTTAAAQTDPETGAVTITVTTEEMTRDPGCDGRTWEKACVRTDTIVSDKNGKTLLELRQEKGCCKASWAEALPANGTIPRIPLSLRPRETKTNAVSVPAATVLIGDAPSDSSDSIYDYTEKSTFIERIATASLNAITPWDIPLRSTAPISLVIGARARDRGRSVDSKDGQTVYRATLSFSMAVESKEYDPLLVTLYRLDPQGNAVEARSVHLIGSTAESGKAAPPSDKSEITCTFPSLALKENSDLTFRLQIKESPHTASRICPDPNSDEHQMPFHPSQGERPMHAVFTFTVHFAVQERRMIQTVHRWAYKTGASDPDESAAPACPYTVSPYVPKQGAEAAADPFDA